MQTQTPTQTQKALSAPVIEQQTESVHRHSAWAVGDVAHQGDVILIGLDKVPEGAQDRKNRQLAEGNTQGSRHILVGGQCFDVKKETVIDLVAKATKGKVKVSLVEYVGPVIASRDADMTVEHPQHQHQTFPPNSVCAVIYQRNVDAEGRIMRARD